MASEAKTKLVPQKESKGTDIFRNSSGTFIVRSDLGCYMICESLDSNHNIRIERLHPACQDGNHYVNSWESLKNPHPYTTIIKGTSMRTVSNLTTDSGPIVSEMHPNCRGGDYYMTVNDLHYVLFLSKGKFHVSSDLSKDTRAADYPLHTDCQKGLYYFGIYDKPALIKVDENWGPQYYQYSNFETGELQLFRSIHPDVLTFLPGGLALTQGASFGAWNLLKMLYNESESTVTWDYQITVTVGYNRKTMSSIEHNWKISSEVSAEPGWLTKLICKAQVKLTAEYGGKSIRVDEETWSETKQTQESVRVSLGPNQKIYLWQYHLGIGQEPILFCRDISVTKTPTPPAYIPPILEV
uniref:Uncharacterized protein n=1 Tax=Sphenodon punctatus TaxID=8508 RepID=A0A8D0GU97_SPHPU